MRRRVALVTLAVLLASVVTLIPRPESSAAADRREAPPNVLLILMDDMRPDELAAMPSVRSIVGDDGLTFTNAVSPTPSCCPARATLLSGQYVHNNGQTVQRSDLNGSTSVDLDHTLPVWLDDLGYHTANLGKFIAWWNAQAPDVEVAPGWDHFFTHFGSYVDRTYMTLDDDGTSIVEHESDIRYSTRALMTEASRLVDSWEATDDTPWYLDLKIYAPHGRATETIEGCDYASRYEKLMMRVPATSGRSSCPPIECPHPTNPVAIEPFIGGPNGVPNFLASTALGWRMTEQETQSYVDCLVAARRGALRIADNRLRLLFAQLERLGEMDETIVIFTSDNGYLLGERGLNRKFLPYPESVRIPLLMIGPGVREGTDDRLTSLVDIAATITAATGARPTLELDGRDLLDIGWTRNEVLLEYFRDPAAPNVRSWAALMKHDELYVEWYDNDGIRIAVELENRWRDDLSFDTDDPRYAGRSRRLAAARTCTGSACP